MLPYEVGDIMPRQLLEQRIEALFPGMGKARLRAAALAMAVSHRYALDYIEQAPVIVLLAAAAATSHTMSTASLDFHARKRLSAGFCHWCERHLSLRELMEGLWALTRSHPGPGIYQLRKLKGGALRTAHWRACITLANIDATTLAQIIPLSQTQQTRWLCCLTAWSIRIFQRRGFDRMDVRDQIAEIAFAARLIAERGMSSTYDGEHMADFMAERANYSTRWSTERFMREWSDWSLMRRKVLASDDIAVDYAPLPNDPVTHAGIEFVPLRTHGALIEESAQMHHCVHAYWPDVVAKQSFIFSMRENGERVATLEVRDEVGNAYPCQRAMGPMPIWCVEQIKAAHNRAPPPHARKAASSFVATIDMPSVGAVK